MIDEKQAYEQRQQARLDEWTAEIEKMKARAKQADAEAKLEMNEKIEEAEAMRNKIEERLDDLRESSGDAWKDVKRGLDEASSSLGSSLREAASQF